MADLFVLCKMFAFILFIALFAEWEREREK